MDNDQILLEAAYDKLRGAPSTEAHNTIKETSVSGSFESLLEKLDVDELKEIITTLYTNFDTQHRGIIVKAINDLLAVQPTPNEKVANQFMRDAQKADERDADKPKGPFGAEGMFGARKK